MNLSKNNFWLVILSLTYPLVIYFCSNRVPGSYLVGGAVCLLLIRGWQARDKNAWYLAGVMSAIMLGLYIWNASMAPLLYPVVMSLSVAALMGGSLIFPPSMIERFARITEPDLDANGVRYTRKVTMVWLAFSLINATIALFTVIWGDRTIWVLYNGCISYILMGLLMAGEYIFRQYYKRKQAQP